MGTMTSIVEALGRVARRPPLAISASMPGWQLILVAVVLVLPAFASDVLFATSAGGESAPLAWSGPSGTVRLVIGALWPLLAVVHMAANKSVALGLSPRHRQGLWVLLLSALYTLTVYLKGFVSLFDSIFLLFLFSAYAWTATRGDSESLGRTSPRDARNDASDRIVWLLPLAVAFALSTLGLWLAEWLVRDGAVAQRFQTSQWTIALASATPLAAVLTVAVGQGRTRAALTVLLTVQILLLTVVPAAVPVAFYVSGSDASQVQLTGWQTSELLLMSAQTLLLVVLLAKMTVKPRGLGLLLVMFSVQVTVAIARPPEGGTTPLDILALAYLGMAGILVMRDRQRFHSLLAMMPGGRLRVPARGRLAPDSKRGR